MKKLLLFFLLFSQSILISQTILNSSVLNLSKPAESGQLINAENTKTHEVYVFASDNKAINILKFNKSLFLANQFKDTLRAEKKRVLMGYSFGEDENPTLYWDSENHKSIRIIKYNLETKKSTSLNFDFPANTGNIITSFQKNNAFYVLSKEKDQEHLLLFEFRNDKCEIKMFDFTSFSFKNEKAQNLSFSALVQYHYPIEKIETDDFSTLDKTEKKSKMYVFDDRIILTFDYNINHTQVFNLNLQTSEVTEKIFDTPVTQTASKSTNSFYLENKLYQLSANSEQFLFSIKDFYSGKDIKTISVTKNDTISFKNSPMFLQINEEKPQKLKTTSKFLKQLSTVNATLSAFKNKQITFITFGGFASYQSFGISYNYGQNNIQDSSKMVFFDAALNSDFEFINNSQAEPLAIDNLNYFMSNSKNILMVSIIKLTDFYILGYYDVDTKSYTMRKFTDGFMDQGFGNPIMNKAIFSKSIPLNRN
ncbi:hypothetical protein IRZ83_05720 [Flavobacterium sp. JLP]|uniref:hypothetical protein n=1 Tax=unclassified Flavobacterium TaxID=196869 RepID=UPI001889CC34|nr:MULTISPECIES: hypothetical protein [unclassified Flavobacterium]MBF4492560.1 hypothetical protein [Flavobacterium sp. MR2016-29]MBF4506161.1 hypothetical protein [Flavobacterium sp. JLP]